jgi:nitroreductase
MDYNSFLELVKERRTIRRFKPGPIPDEYVEKIIEAARWAPSGYNSQPWEFVVLKDKKIIETIMQGMDDYWAISRKAETYREPWMRQAMHPWLDPEMDFRHAPVYIIIFGDTRTQDGLPMMIRYDNQRKQTIFLSSLANAYLYMSLAATTLGLANEWVSSIATASAYCQVKDLLGIPKELEVYDMMALGYPACKSRPKLMRDRTKMVHYDYCGEEDFRTDEEVRDFIRRTRAWVSANHRRGADKSLVG